MSSRPRKIMANVRPGSVRFVGPGIYGMDAEVTDGPSGTLCREVVVTIRAEDARLLSDLLSKSETIEAAGESAAQRMFKHMQGE